MNKYIKCLIALAALPLMSNAQIWVRSATPPGVVTLGTSTDFVGIGGTTGPTYTGNKFEVRGGGVMLQSSAGGLVRFENPSGEEGMTIHTTSGQRADFRLNSSGLKIGCENTTSPVSNNNLLFCTPSGRFGFGMAPTTYKVEVAGDTKVNGVMDVDMSGPSVNVLTVKGWTTEALIDARSIFSGAITPSPLKTGLFVNRTDNNDVNTSGAEIHGRVLGIRTTADVGFSAGNTIGVDVGSFTTDGDAYGVNVESRSNGINHGVHSVASSATSTEAVGLWGRAWSGVPNATIYGVYGNAPIQINSYAGYFVGDVFTTGAYLPSDRKLKKEIEPLNSALQSILRLKPATYLYNTDAYSQMNLQKGKRYGFIAEELEEVFPVLVKQSRHPEEKDDKGNVIKEAVDFKAVNYIELIPVLTKAIQEQQQQIDAQQAQIEELKAALANKTGVSDGIGGQSNGFLGQNAPNPFTRNTIISYKLPASTQTAAIGVYDLSGREVKLVPLGTATEGNVTIEADSLHAGMYVYSLIINGQPFETKKMILSAN